MTNLITKILISLFFAGYISINFAQQDTIKLVKYSPEYQFKEGVYLNFHQVKENRPIQKSRIATDLNTQSLDFFTELMKKEEFAFYDDFGIKKVLKTEDLWGYCRKGTLYINWNENFIRIPFVGNISHFIANITVYRDRPYDPYYYNSYYNYPTTDVSNELKQFLLDFETGKIIEFTTKNLLIILMRDPVLYEEFVNLRKRKQKKLKFLYVRKYNEKHPLYLPLNNE